MASSFTSKAMWKAVAASVILGCLSTIASHYLWGRINYDAVPAELFENGEDAAPPPSFWLERLPKTATYLLICCPLSYRFQCWLEWLFPGRRRGGQATTRVEARNDKLLDAETDDELEEQIMKKLIAKGKVKRSGLSWLNTFVKWFISMTVVKLTFCVIWILLEALWHRHGVSSTRQQLSAGIIPMWIFSLFSFDTLASLIGYIVVPVQHRLPFWSGVHLAWTVFVGAFMNAFIPFVLSHDISQEFIRNQTEAMRLAKNATAHNETLPTTLLEVGEL